jgi:putative ABC transport system permease protein
MGIPLMLGRDFDASDDLVSPDVAVVNSAFVDRFWPGENPIGKTLASGLDGQHLTVVVGVVADSKYRTLGEDRQSFAYMSVNQNMEGTANLIVNAPSADASMLATIRDELALIDENVPVTNIALLEDRLGIVLLLPRLGASLFGGVGMIGLILAATGILGVMSFAVSQRTHEIGVRMALGAGPSTVLGMVMREGVSLALIGLAAGGALAFGLTRFLSGMLVGVGASDPVTMAGVAVVILSVTVTACYIPARRALRVDPVVALREE